MLSMMIVRSQVAAVVTLETMMPVGGVGSNLPDATVVPVARALQPFRRAAPWKLNHTRVDHIRGMRGVEHQGTDEGGHFESSFRFDCGQSWCKFAV